MNILNSQDKRELAKEMLLQGIKGQDIISELRISTATLAKIKKEIIEEQENQPLSDEELEEYEKVNNAFFERVRSKPNMKGLSKQDDYEGEGFDMVEEEIDVNYIEIVEPQIDSELKNNIENLKNYYEEKDIFGNQLVSNIRKEIDIPRDKLIDILRDIDKENDSFKELNQFITGKERYKTTSTHYIFYKTLKDKYGVKEKKEFEIKKEVIDKIFKDFSKHWNDLSWEDVRKKYNMTPAAFELIKSATWLYKGSNVISDGTLKTLSDDKLTDLITESVNSRLSDKYTNKFREVWSNRKEQEYKKALNYMGQTEFLFERIQETITSWKSREFKPVKLSNYKVKEGVVAFGDVHMWLKTLKKDGFKLQTNSDIISKRLREISGYVASKEWTKATLVFNWDLFEWMQYNMMHPMQWMEADLFWIDQLNALTDTTEQMALDIINSWKKIKILVKRGNHDRADTNHNDKVWIFAAIFAQLLKKWLKPYIEKWYLEIEYSWEDVTTMLIGKLNYIIYHWDILSPKTNLSTITTRYWFPMNSWIFNVVIVSHWHSNMLDECLNALRYRLSAIVTSNEYAEWLGANSLPWFAVFEESQLGFPEYTQKRFSL